MTYPIRRSLCQTIPETIKKGIPAALVLLNPKISAIAAMAWGSCAMIKSGLSDFGQKQFAKGAVKTLVGAAGVGATFFFAHDLTSVVAADCPSFLGPEKQADDRLDEIAEENLQLSNRVTQTLQDGGHLLFNSSASGLYLIVSKLGQTIATFKPEDERNWGPKNRLYDHRKPEMTPDDIYFLQLSGFDQGKASARQHLARILDFAENARLPIGLITDMESDQFFDLEAGQSAAHEKKQKKMGYLQEWLEVSGPISSPNEVITSNHSLINQIPIDEFQEAAITSTLLYNQDGHTGNYLYRYDANGVPHLRPIDMDVILPWKLTDYVGIASHNRSQEPFTQNSLKLIRKLDPAFVGEVTKRMHLSEQAEINAQALAIVLQQFSAANLTLANIYRFITHPQPDVPSPLWQMMIQSRDAAIQALPKEDQDRFIYAEFCRWSLWRGNASSNAREELNHYRQHEAPRINQAIEAVFWRVFTQNLNQYIALRMPI